MIELSELSEYWLIIGICAWILASGLVFAFHSLLKASKPSLESTLENRVGEDHTIIIIKAEDLSDYL